MFLGRYFKPMPVAGFVGIPRPKSTPATSTRWGCLPEKNPQNLQDSGDLSSRWWKGGLLFSVAFIVDIGPFTVVAHQMFCKELPHALFEIRLKIAVTVPFAGENQHVEAFVGFD